MFKTRGFILPNDGVQVIDAEGWARLNTIITHCEVTITYKENGFGGSYEFGVDGKFPLPLRLKKWIIEDVLFASEPRLPGTET